MRNLKRVLSLALALVMVLGMMVVTTSAAAFTDAEEITFTEAVDVATGLGLFEGYDDGEMKPTVVLTREQAATLITRIMLGDKLASQLTPTQQIFDDVATTRWSAAAIEYCYNIEMIDGLGDGTFDPTGELTGTAFAKLLLCAMGYDAAAEGYTGKDWKKNINADALAAGLYVAGVNITAPLTREAAAQMILQALEAKTVYYTTYYDYATGAPVVAGPIPVTPAKAAKDYTGANTNTYVEFCEKYFSNLKVVEAAITDTYAKDGETTIDSVVLENTDADWTTVGYAARAWYLEGKKANTALSLVVTGEDLSVTTDGTKLTGNYSLTQEKNGTKNNPNYVADLEADEAVLYVLNGEKSNATAVATAAAKTGAKIALVNNDRDAAIDAVVATVYTPAVVSAVERTSVSGDVSVTGYYLNGSYVSAKKVVCANDLAKGDFVTAISVDGVTFVTVCEIAAGEYENKETEKLADETKVVYYTVAGEEYVTSDLTSWSYDGLSTKYFNEDIIIVLDEYGYILYAVEYTDPDSYLYVVENERTNSLTDVAEAVVVYVDGTVDIIEVSTVDKDEFLGIDEYANIETIFSYTEKKGAYALETEVTYVAEDDDFDTNDIKFGDAYMTKESVIIDIRDVIKGKADEGTVYVGYDELPDLNNAKIVYVKDAYAKDLTIDFGYLVSGEDASASKVIFTVFNTDTTLWDSYKVGNKTVKTYELEAGVILYGQTEATENYILNETQKAYIDQYGVGQYYFKTVDGVTSLVSYVSFYEDSVYWTPESTGTLIKDDADITGDYATVFLNIDDGEINDWDEVVTKGTYYAIFDDIYDIAYIVAEGDVATGESFVGYDGYIYTSGDCKVTKVEAPVVEDTFTIVVKNYVDGVKPALACDGGKITENADGSYTVTVAGNYFLHVKAAEGVKSFKVVLGDDNTELKYDAANDRYAITGAKDEKVVVEIHGEFELNQYVVNFNTHSTMAVASKTITINSTAADCALETLAVEGWDFLGWYTAEADGEKVADLTAYKGLEGTTTLHAQWAPKTNTVTFEYYNNKGELIVSNTQSTTIKSNETKNVILGTVAGEQYVLGTLSSANCTAVAYAAGEAYTLTGITKDTTIKVVVYTADQAVVGTKTNEGGITILGGAFSGGTASVMFGTDGANIVKGYVAVLGADGYWYVISAK